MSLTWRIEVVESKEFSQLQEQKKPMVFAHWHGDDPVVAFLIKPYNVAIMTSTSADGEMMDRIVRLFGAETVRGSSTRGGVGGLKGLIRLSRRGRVPSLAVDGPKGPRHVVKPGVFEISKILGASVCPVGVSISSKWVFEKSWNKVYLPKPFAKIVLYWGEPMASIGRKGDAKNTELLEQLALRLRESEALAAKRMNGEF